MKKSIFWCVLALAAIGMTACNNTPDCYYHSKTFDLDVKAGTDWAWQFDTVAQQFYCHFDVPDLNFQVYNYGNWSISREYNGGKKDAYQVALPQSLYMTEDIEDPNTHEVHTVYYTQHIDYRVGIGYVEIQLTNSDYLYGQKDPEDMTFRLQLIY